METLSSMQGFQITDSINNYLPMLSASWQDQQTVYHMNALSKFVKKRQKKHLYKCLDISRCCITPETFITASSQPEVTPDLRPVTWQASWPPSTGLQECVSVTCCSCVEHHAFSMSGWIHNTFPHLHPAITECQSKTTTSGLFDTFSVNNHTIWHSS